MMKRLAFASCLLAISCKANTSATCVAPDATAEYDMQFRFVNLGRETVSVQLDGEASARAVAPQGSHHLVKHVSVALQKGTVQARNFLADGTATAVSFPIEFDVSSEPSVTFVLKDTTPSRISMNVTVGKQTQGSTFGERVQAGLAGVDLGGGIDTGGDCAADLGAAGTAVMRLRDENTCDDSDAPWYRRPAGVSTATTPYFVHGDDDAPLVYWLEDMQPGTLPGGAVISAAVSSMYILNAHGGNAAAKVGLSNNPLFQSNVNAGSMVRVKPSELSLILANAAEPAMFARPRRSFTVQVGSSSQTVTLGATYTGPCRPPYLCDEMYGQDLLLVISESMNEEHSMLRTKHDTAKNSVSNVRGMIVFDNTASVDSSACIFTSQADKGCVMGAARVQAGLTQAGAALASGRLLLPPKVVQGSPAPTFILSEGGSSFTWTGTSPVVDPASSGFAIAAAGGALNGSSANRALFFVNTSVTPWAVTSALSD